MRSLVRLSRPQKHRLKPMVQGGREVRLAISTGAQCHAGCRRIISCAFNGFRLGRTIHDDWRSLPEGVSFGQPSLYSR